MLYFELTWSKESNWIIFLVKCSTQVISNQTDKKIYSIHFSHDAGLSFCGRCVTYMGFPDYYTIFCAFLYDI